MTTISDYGCIQVAGGDTGQPLALAKRLDLIRCHLRGGGNRFLDCGCGAGEYVFQLMNRLGLDAWGVEFDAEKVARGRAHATLGQRISQGDVQKLAFADSDFDYALLNEVLEHVPEDSAALKEVYRILKPAGVLFVFSPNRWFPFETHGVYWKRSNRFVPPWVPLVPYIPLGIGRRFLRYWARNYGQQELRQAVVRAGFSILHTSFVWQTFEGISGRQPRWVGRLKPVLRQVANGLEQTPFLTRFGVSQALVCQKPPNPP
jgi:ubiquinone/menaquinone biosynthesis C-methylase UbiE